MDRKLSGFRLLKYPLDHPRLRSLPTARSRSLVKVLSRKDPAIFWSCQIVAIVGFCAWIGFVAYLSQATDRVDGNLIQPFGAPSMSALEYLGLAVFMIVSGMGVAAILGTIAANLCAHYMINKKLSKLGHLNICLKCLYDLQGTGHEKPHRCPECGKVVVWFDLNGLD